MNEVANNLKSLKDSLPSDVTLIAVSKTYAPEIVMQAYEAGQRVFGENKVQELTAKYEALPKDIQWHLIGHLQSNKVKYIAPFVHLIHSIDSLKLLQEVNKQAAKCNRVIDCLLQVHIAQEESKFGMSPSDVKTVLGSKELKELKNVKITGLMGMATFTDNQQQVRSEFKTLKDLFDDVSSSNPEIKNLSMGMSDDHRLAIEEGSNMIRVGSLIFGKRNYSA